MKLDFQTESAFALHTGTVNISYHSSFPSYLNQYTGCFNRNDIFKLFIFLPKNQYFSEGKDVLNRLLWDILKNKRSL